MTFMIVFGALFRGISKRTLCHKEPLFRITNNSVDVLISCEIYASPLPSLYLPSCLRVNEISYSLPYLQFRMLDLNCI
jgi:hypothetical protein